MERAKVEALSFSACALSRRLEEAAIPSTLSDSSWSSLCKAAVAAAAFFLKPVALRKNGLLRPADGGGGLRMILPQCRFYSDINFLSEVLGKPIAVYD